MNFGVLITEEEWAKAIVALVERKSELSILTEKTIHHLQSYTILFKWTY